MTTSAELETHLQSIGEAEAAHTVALINALIQGSMDLHDVDFVALQAKVTNLNTLLDGDPNTEGYQAFEALIARVTANEGAVATLQTDVSAAQAAITALQGLVNGLTAQAADFITRAELAAKATAQGTAFVNALWSEAGKTPPAGLANPDGTTTV